MLKTCRTCSHISFFLKAWRIFSSRVAARTSFRYIWTSVYSKSIMTWWFGWKREENWASNCSCPEIKTSNYNLLVGHHGVARDFYYQLSLSLPLSPSLSSYFSLSLSIFLPLSLYLSHYHSLFIILTLSLSLSLSLYLSHSLFIFFTFSLSFPLASFFLSASLKNPCSSKFCDKMLAAAAPSRRQHIYYIDSRVTKLPAHGRFCGVSPCLMKVRKYYFITFKLKTLITLEKLLFSTCPLKSQELEAPW